MNKKEKIPVTRRKIGNRNLFIIIMASLVSGCSGRSHERSELLFADDYRRNFPIVIGQKEQTFDLLVTTHQKRATLNQAESLAGFLTAYDTKMGSILFVALPLGSENQLASASIVNELMSIVRLKGVPAKKIVISRYRASPSTLAPVRFSFQKLQAYTHECGKWKKDIFANEDANLHSPNFGCSYQQNLAAQIINPYDFTSPRKRTPIDSATRDKIIEGYRNSDRLWNPETKYD